MHVDIKNPEDYFNGVMALVNAIHLYDYDLLLCPLCNESLWIRILTAVETPIIEKYW